MATLDCGHEPSEHSSFLPVSRREGRTFCYECAADMDRADMIATGRATLYMTDNGITNWPGSLRFITGPVRVGRHNIARRRYDTWFTGPDGKPWHAVRYGDNTQIAHCKRVKSF